MRCNNENIVKRRTKIIYICRRFNSDKWGGTETVIIQTAKQLIKMGFEVQVFTTNALSNTNDEYVDGVRIRRFNYFLPCFGLSKTAIEKLLCKGGNIMSISLLWHLMLEPNISMIHLHSTHRIGGIGRTVSKIRKIPFVISLHAGWLSTPKHENDTLVAPIEGKIEWGKIFGFILGSRRVMKDAKAIICVGKSEADAVRKKLPKKQIEYLPNGVNPKKFDTANELDFRTKYKLSPKTKIILCISRIDYQKNQMCLVKSFFDLRKTFHDSHLILIGSVTVPDYYEKLKAQIKDLHLEKHVTIIPGLNPQDPLLYSAYKACDLFVLPSLHEPFGIVILEAWAAQKPVIASNIGGIVGFTANNEDCLLVEPNNAEELTSMILRILRDKKLSRKLASNGYDKAIKYFNWETITNKLVEIYDLTKKVGVK